MYQPILVKDLGKNDKLVNRNGLKICETESSDDVGGNNDERINVDQMMEKQFSPLETNGIEITDIAKYMDNLKEKHSRHDDKQFDSNRRTDSTKKLLKSGSSCDAGGETSDDCKETKQPSSEDESMHVVIDRRIDKIFKGDKMAKVVEHVEVANVSHSRSPDRNGSKSATSAPIKIIKLNSPRPMKRKLSSEKSSRSNSRERQSSPGARRPAESGISKPQLSSSAPTGGILKRNVSPMHSGHYLDTFGHQLSTSSLSPHNSFDDRSPEVLLVRRPSGSYQSYCIPKYYCVSPCDDRKRSLSAHSSFIRSQPSDSECYSHRPYDYYRRSNSPDYERGKRLSKSLERTTTPARPTSMYYCPQNAHGMSYPDAPIRSQSLENALMMNARAQGERYSSRSNDSLMQFQDFPTCVECLYQRKPS